MKRRSAALEPRRGASWIDGERRSRARAATEPMVAKALFEPTQYCARALLFASLALPVWLGPTEAALSQTAAPVNVATGEEMALPGELEPVERFASNDLALAANGPQASGSASGSADPKKMLLEQAAYWRSRSQPDRAISTLKRLLSIGENADALAMLARAQIDAGQTNDAAKTIARLRKLNHDDPRIGEIEHDLQVGQPNPARLDEARTLAQEGRATQAVKVYQQAFNGGAPPSKYASEYYLTLGGTPAGFDAARKALGQIVASNPHDLRAQVAYAKLLSYDEGTRDEGVKRLNLLSQSASVQREADDALRQALQWLPDTSDSLDAVEAYVKRHPDDAQLAKKLALIRNPPLTPTEVAGKARMSGYDAMDKQAFDEAEQDFKKALSINSDDPDATAGLGFLRIKQGRIDEGRALLKHAKELGPTDEEGIDATLNSTDPAATAKVDEGALKAIKAQYERVTVLTKRRRFAEAEELLRKLGGADPNWGFYLQLGGIEALAGKLKEAEATYRRALELKPGNPATTIALAGTLLRQHREREAEALYVQVGDTHAVGQIRAERLRSEARHVTDPVAQVGLYRQAVQADPTNPWLRLELARALLRQGRGADARSVMASVYGRGATAQGVEAGFYFAVELSDLRLAAALAARVPPAKRTSQMVSVQERVAIRDEIAQATRDTTRGTLRTTLLALAAAPDPTGVRVEEIARTLVGLNDRQGAADAVATQMAANADLTFGQRIAYANALAGASHEFEGERLLASVDEGGLSRDQRKALDAARDSVSIALADRLRFDSSYGQASEQLEARLRLDPDNPGLNMALARLYVSEAKLGRAVAITQELLARNPSSFDVKKAAIDALVAVGDLDRAEALAQDAIQASPDNPRAYMAAAEVARRRDDDGRVIQDLRAAKQLLRAEAAREASSGSDGQSTATEGQQYADASEPVAVNSSNNAFRPGPLAEGQTGEVPNVLADANVVEGDLENQRIDAEIATLRDDVSPQVRAGFGYLARSGEDGLSRLSVITTPTEASFSPGGEGILRAQVTPTIIDGRTPGTSNGALQDFGTNPLQSALGLPLGIAGDQAGAGVGLDFRYTYRFASVDIGSTPLGFLRPNVIGGIELAPLLTPELRLRLTADRRAVINSVLSYSGARDPVTDAIWGAVVRNRGFAQLEWAPGRWFVFGGAGGGVVTGDHVQNNSFEEAILGASYGLYENGPQEFRFGVNVPYLNYAQNQNSFSFGNGGYFSPQNFVAILPTFAWRDQPTDHLTYRLSTTVGYQSFTQKQSQTFPEDPGLQSLLSTAAGGYPTLMAGTMSQGLSYGAEGEFEYKISDEWRFGGRAAFQKAGDYTEGSGVLYGRYIFDTVSR